MPRPVHFEIQADDLDRAKAFYAEVFGWTYEDYSQFTNTTYFGVTTGPEDEIGINGGLMPRPSPAPAPDAGEGTNAFVCTIGVDDYDSVEKKILQAGGTVSLAKAALPGMAWQGYYVDTEGNIFGLHQADPEAR